VSRALLNGISFAKSLSLITTLARLTYKGGSIMDGYANKVGKTLLLGVVIAVVAGLVYMVGVIL